uniref:Uncharacterized protein n=1 Tax=Sparus aurata TaxID=8175 RepID=A0A671UXA9_SPAAU
MYSVICFDKDEEVEVAPTAWFHEGTCRWPPYKSQGVQRAVKQLEEAQSTWPVHTDFIGLKLLYCYFYIHLQHVMSLGSSLRQAIDQSYGDMAGSEQQQSSDMAGSEQQQSSSMAETAAAQPISPPYHGYMRGCNQMCGSKFEGCLLPTVTILFSALLKEVLVNQQILMDQQKNIIRMIQDMQRSTNAVTGIPTTNVFPLNDKPALYALERDLGSQPDLRNKLVITLGLVGGATVKETVWRILKQAIKNDLAKTISWRGLNGKVPFEKLHLRAVVTDAVRRNPVCIEATDLSIADAIKRWFYWAGDRGGGRKNRLPGASRPTV